MVKKALPTMKDVAEEAGVSLGTVSKVFNNMAVGQEYRDRVLRAAEKIGYRFNSYASGMKAGKTNTIALILPNLTNRYFAVLAEMISKALKDSGCRMLLYVTHSHEQEEEECLRLAEQYHVDGIIALPHSNTMKINKDIPIVTIDRFLEHQVPCVSSDNYGGGQLAARKLMEFGCRRLLGIEVASPVAAESDKRIDGFRSACVLAGVSHSLCWNAEDDYDMVWKHMKDHIHDGHFDYDGVFCSTDELAQHYRTALVEEGISVPEDVQIIGFDGICEFEKRTLYCSTIVQPVKEIADTAVNLLLQKEYVPASMVVALPIHYASGNTTLENPKK